MASPPTRMKPETSGEATGKHSVDIPGWLGAARTERETEEPGRSGGAHLQRRKGNDRDEYISPKGSGRKSDSPIVAEKRLTPVEPRGGTVNTLTTTKGVPPVRDLYGTNGLPARGRNAREALAFALEARPKGQT